MSSSKRNLGKGSVSQSDSEGGKEFEGSETECVRETSGRQTEEWIDFRAPCHCSLDCICNAHVPKPPFNFGTNRDRVKGYKELAQYFEANWFACEKLWAKCFHQYDCNNMYTNNACESVNRSIKSILQHCIDKWVDTVLKAMLTTISQRFEAKYMRSNLLSYRDHHTAKFFPDEVIRQRPYLQITRGMRQKLLIAHRAAGAMKDPEVKHHNEKPHVYLIAKSRRTLEDIAKFFEVVETNMPEEAKWYFVDTKECSCTCPVYIASKRPCKHIIYIWGICKDPNKPALVWNSVFMHIQYDNELVNAVNNRFRTQFTPSIMNLAPSFKQVTVAMQAATTTTTTDGAAASNDFSYTYDNDGFGEGGAYDDGYDGGVLDSDAEDVINGRAGYEKESGHVITKFAIADEATTMRANAQHLIHLLHNLEVTAKKVRGKERQMLFEAMKAASKAQLEISAHLQSLMEPFTQLLLAPGADASRKRKADDQISHAAKMSMTRSVASIHDTRVRATTAIPHQEAVDTVHVDSLLRTRSVSPPPVLPTLPIPTNATLLLPRALLVGKTVVGAAPRRKRAMLQTREKAKTVGDFVRIAKKKKDKKGPFPGYKAPQALLEPQAKSTRNKGARPFAKLTDAERKDFHAKWNTRPRLGDVSS